MSRAVLDTNVLVSGIAGFVNPRSIPGELLRQWRRGAFDLVLSDHIVSELERTLLTPYFQKHVKPEQMERVHTLLSRYAIRTSLKVKVEGIATHPEDDLILATALSAKATYLVTGDSKLRAQKRYKSVEILTPRAFLAILQEELSRN